MPHRRRALNPTLPPPPPAAAAAFHLAADDSRLPLLAADYALLQSAAAAAATASSFGDAPAAPASAEWSAGSAFTASSDAATTTASSTATAPGSARLTAAEEEAGGRDTWVRRAREGYYLQLSLAIRLTSQAFLAGAPAPPELLLGCGPGDAGDGANDPEAVSYRLWVRAHTASDSQSYGHGITHEHI
jgi:hypothetical protein